MKFLSQFFSKKFKQTSLEKFLSAIKLEQAQRNYQSVQNINLRLPAALSTWVLFLTHSFASGLREMSYSLNKKSNAKEVYAYDPVAFETAVFCYFWLMREFLNAENEDLDESSYFECLNQSAQITYSLLLAEANFDVPDDLAMDRCIAYSRGEKFNGIRPEEKFAEFLISSVQSGAPAKRTAVGVSSSLPLQLVVTAYIPIFISTRLNEFKKVARNMFLAHQDSIL